MAGPFAIRGETPPATDTSAQQAWGTTRQARRRTAMRGSDSPPLVPQIIPRRAAPRPAARPGHPVTRHVADSTGQLRFESSNPARSWSPPPEPCFSSERVRAPLTPLLRRSRVQVLAIDVDDVDGKKAAAGTPNVLFIAASPKVAKP